MVKSHTILLRKRDHAWVLRQRRKPNTIACFHCVKYTPLTTRRCSWKHCVEWYCTTCGRYNSGYGPVGCPCEDRTKRGHLTRAEQRRPRPPYKPSARTRNHPQR